LRILETILALAKGQEIYRIAKNQKGIWITRKLGKTIGDNIALVRQIHPNAGLAEALYHLTQGPIFFRKRDNTDLLARQAEEVRLAEQAELARQAAKEVSRLAGLARQAAAAEQERIRASARPAPEQEALPPAPQKPKPPQQKPTLAPGDAARLRKAREQGRDRGREGMSMM
jgi:hypothetical protein